MIFTKKALRVTFVLNGPSVFANGKKSLVLTDLRVSAEIDTAQFPSTPGARIGVWGMKQSDMNTLIAIQYNPFGILNNSIMVEANSGSGWSTAYAGDIVTAQPQYQDAPNVSLQVLARTLFVQALAKATPTSYTGSTDVSTIISGLASRMGCTFTDEGVQATLNAPYFAGTLHDQLKAVVQHSNISVYYDYAVPGDSTSPITGIVIAPKGAARNIQTITLTPKTGLVGYPTIDSMNGNINATCLYNPGLRFGGPLTISGSDVPPANATWSIQQLSHRLESITPDGAWFSSMYLANPTTAVYKAIP